MISKVWKFIKILFWPILFGIGQFFICGLFMLIYVLQNKGSSTNVEQFINHYTLFIVFIECIIFIPIFYSEYRKYYVDKEKYSIHTICFVVIISFLLSSILNFVIILCKTYFKIHMTSSITITGIVATGIVGPILEEFLFRGVVYEKLRYIFKEKSAFYISILIFALFHTGGIFQVFFAFIIGFYLTYIYRQYKDIRLSMLAHIIVNMASILLSPLILSLF